MTFVPALELTRVGNVSLRNRSSICNTRTTFHIYVFNINELVKSRLISKMRCQDFWLQKYFSPLTNTHYTLTKRH